MSKPAILNLSVLYDDQRAELIMELEGCTVVITEGTIRAYKDAQEVPAHLDMIGGVLRMDNPVGIYRVSADGDESDQGDTPPKPGDLTMTNLVSDIWAKRTGRTSDADAVARLRDVYANRQAQFTA